MYLNSKIMLATFNCFDRDSDGSISLSELSSGHLLGTLSMEELHEIMTWADENQNGQTLGDLRFFKQMSR